MNSTLSHRLQKQSTDSSKAFDSRSLTKQAVGWLVGCIGLNATLTAKVISWRSVTLSHTSTNTTFFPKPPTTFLTCFSRGERRKYARKKVRLNWVSNSQPQGHESYTLTNEPPGQGTKQAEETDQTIRSMLSDL